MPATFIGKWLIIFGATVILIGALFWMGILPGKLGHLPGDINVKRDGFSVHVWIGTSIVLSILLTLILNLIFRMRH